MTEKMAKIGTKEKFIVRHDADGTISEPKKTRCEYKEGDIINVASYSNQYKCIETDVTEDTITYHFKQAKMIYTYDY
jgi:hypothetical protein